MYDRIYTTDPAKFVQDAYFECVVALKEKTRRVAQVVFGPDHRYMKALFDKGEQGFSLYDIRGKLAHGGLTLLDREDETNVRKRLHEIASISKEFLTRIIFLLGPTDPLPAWSGRQIVGFPTTDPRATMVVTQDLAMLPTTDWRIRPQWCEPN